MDNQLKSVCKENMCGGCMACVDACPKNAISIQDNKRSLNAVIDTDKCVDCGLCAKLCQVNNTPALRKPISWYQGWASDKVREGGSSGGLASAIIDSFDGVVCSCVFSEGKFVFSFDQEKSKYAGSKYVKSNPSGVYKAIKDKLLGGEKVLFIGLPCQCSAVKNYVKDTSNLYLIDLICHGTPSSKVLEDYLSEAGLSLSDLEDIRFRCKIGADMAGYKRTTPKRIKDFYTHAFLTGLSYTDNCYQCSYARLERVSDLTLGDSWESDLGDDASDKGISLILCQTDKGRKLLDAADVTLVDVDLDKAVAGNTQLRHPSIEKKERVAFFEALDNGFEAAIKAADKSYYVKCGRKKLLIKLGLMNGDVLASRFGISYK